MWERFYHIKEHVGSPWLSASNGYIGFDFYLWLISMIISLHLFFYHPINTYLLLMANYCRIY